MFHYTTIDALCEILKSKKLWLVSSLEMDDVTDRFYANLATTIVLLTSENEEVALLRKHLTPEDILRINMETLEVPFYSLSFCERNDNEYLWKNYAENNNGVCIEFDEKYCKEYVYKTIELNYQALDDNSIPPQKEMIEKRKVYYGYREDVVCEVLKATKEMAIETDPKVVVTSNQKFQYENWLFLTISILAGTIKANEFSKEEEVRYLYQDRYSNEYINKHPYYIFSKYELLLVLEKLGLDKTIINNGKKRIELDFSNIFDTKFIKSITVGNCSKENIIKIKKFLRDENLDPSILKDRNGNTI